MASLKASAKTERWHKGDAKTLTALVVMDAADFASLFADIQTTAQSAVVTTLSLQAADLSALLGDSIAKLKVPTWSMPRSFQKAWKTGDAALSFRGAEGKFSRGTSTLTLKFAAEAEGGDDAFGGDW